MGLCAVVITQLRAASVRGVTRGGEAKSCAFIPEGSWLSWGVRTVQQATQEHFRALTWGRRGGTNYWPCGLVASMLNMTAWCLWASTTVQASASLYFCTLVGVNTPLSDVQSRYFSIRQPKNSGAAGRSCAPGLPRALGSPPLPSQLLRAEAWSDGLSPG